MNVYASVVFLVRFHYHAEVAEISTIVYINSYSKYGKETVSGWTYISKILVYCLVGYQGYFVAYYESEHDNVLLLSTEFRVATHTFTPKS